MTWLQEKSTSLLNSLTHFLKYEKINTQATLRRFCWAILPVWAISFQYSAGSTIKSNALMLMLGRYISKVTVTSFEISVLLIIDLQLYFITSELSVFFFIINIFFYYFDVGIVIYLRRKNIFRENTDRQYFLIFFFII